MNAEILLNEPMKIPKDSKFKLKTVNFFKKGIIVFPGKAKSYLSKRSKIQGEMDESFNLDTLFNRITDEGDKRVANLNLNEEVRDELLSGECWIGMSYSSDAAVLADEEENIWLGVEDRLYQYKFPDKKATLFKDQKGILEKQKIDLSFLLDSRFGNFFWVGTNNNGLFKLDPKSGTLEHFTSAAGSKVVLPSNRILGITETEPNLLWLATSNGLCKIDLRDYSTKTFTSKDGLPNNFINAVILQSK